MWARLESNTIVEILRRPTSLLLNGLRYPANIFNLWSEEELKAIGIYEVVEDNTNLKDRKYYINTDQSFAFASGTVTATYGTATARAIADVTNADDSITVGLKSIHKEQINTAAAGLLQEYDWYTLRAASGGTAIPSSITTYQAAVRTKSGDMETLIDNAANVDALAALYVYTDGTRPLGDWPSKPE